MRYATQARASYLSKCSQRTPWPRPGPCAALAGLKQRLLSFLFLNAQRLEHCTAASEGPMLRPLQLFFRHFCNFNELLLWRAHLLDDAQLLLQFSFPDALVRRDAVGVGLPSIE